MYTGGRQYKWSKIELEFGELKSSELSQEYLLMVGKQDGAEGKLYGIKVATQISEDPMRSSEAGRACQSCPTCENRAIVTLPWLVIGCRLPLGTEYDLGKIAHFRGGQFSIPGQWLSSSQQSQQVEEEYASLRWGMRWTSTQCAL